MFLFEIAVILIAAKLAGDVVMRWGIPPVVGQLLAGLVLGTVFTALGPLPALQSTQPLLKEMSDLGVVLLMFLVGLETNWEQLHASRRAAVSAASGGAVISLVSGVAIGLLFGLSWLESVFAGVILMATSVTITAQTLIELESLQTLEGTTVLGAAVVDDVIGLVAFSALIVATGSSTANVPLLLLALVVFFLFSATLAPRLLTWFLNKTHTMRGAEVTLAVALAIALVYGVAAQNAGLAPITGAYIAGLLINRHNKYPQLTDGMRTLAYGLFVPIFLVKTGSDVRLEQIGPMLGFVLAAGLTAAVAKIVGCGAGARLCGLTTRQSAVVGAGMVSRGEVSLVVASIALGAGLITDVLFSTLIIIVLVTALVTPLLLRLALRPPPQSRAPKLAADTA